MERRRRRDETKNVKYFDTPNSTFTSVKTRKPRSFFKLMLSPSSQSQILRIPEKFVKAYREELSASANVVLAVPTGETWNVTLVEDDNKLWFREGWSDFVNKYSVDYGYFMLFRYEGNLRFNVHVFDLTACEITYRFDQEPSRDHLGPQQTDNDDNDDDHDEDDEEEEEEEDDDDDNDGDDDDDDSDFECIGSPLRKRKDYSDARVVISEGEEDDEMQSDDESVSNSDSKMEVDSEDDEMASLEGTETRSDSEIDVRCSKLESELPIWLKSFKTKLKNVFFAGFPIPANPYFVAVISLYHLSSCGFMHVPKEFAHTYLNCKGKKVTVELRDGSQCAVRFVENNRRSCSLSQGWPLAAQRARLKVGNLCFLELIDDKNWVLKLYAAKLSYN